MLYSPLRNAQNADRHMAFQFVQFTCHLSFDSVSHVRNFRNVRKQNHPEIEFHRKLNAPLTLA